MQSVLAVDGSLAVAVPTASVLPSPQHLLGFSVRYDRRRVGGRGCGGGRVRVRIRVREKR